MSHKTILDLGKELWEAMGIEDDDEADWKDEFEKLFNFTLGLYVGTRINDETIREILGEKNEK